MADDTHSSTAATAGAVAARARANGHSAEPAGDHDRATDTWLDRLLAAIGLRGGDRAPEGLRDALAEDRNGDPLFSSEERQLLENILGLRDLRINDVMVPRADIEAVEENASIDDILRLFREAGHSRMPVYRETLDDPIGFVHIKDVMAHIADGARIASEGDENGLDLGRVDLSERLAVLDIVRPVLFVPASMRAVDLLVRMRASRVQLALVIDEYGGTDGLVTLEDLVETIIGDIEDEHDETEAPMLQVVSDGVWTADARLPLEDFQEETGLALASDDYRDDVDTLGGLVFALLGRIPVRGELIASDEMPGVEFEVLEADPRRIHKLKIERRARGHWTQASSSEENSPALAGRES